MSMIGTINEVGRVIATAEKDLGVIIERQKAEIESLKNSDPEAASVRQGLLTLIAQLHGSQQDCRQMARLLPMVALLDSGGRAA